MKKIFFLINILITSLNCFSQFSVSAGPSLIKPFGIKGMYPAFHISGEFGIDDLSSFYGRFTFAPSKSGEETKTVITALDFNTSPPVLEINSTEKFNYSILEFGRRYYFGEGYESGLSFYGSSNLNLIFNKVSVELDEYDKSKYQTTSGGGTNGSIVSLGFGLNGGVKHAFSFGTLFFDTGLNFSIFGLKSDPNIYSDQYKSLFFNFNFGYRKYFY